MTSDLPRRRRARIGEIRAIRAGAYRSIEMSSELGVQLLDARHRVAHGLRHARPRALRWGTRAPVTTAEADRARELANEEVPFGTRARNPAEVPERARFGDVLV